MKKSNTIIKCLQFLFMAGLLFTVVFLIRKLEIVSDIKCEDVYWERARYLLGQGGVSFFGGSSLCSLGYSLFLAPIGWVISNARHAYRLAIAVNGVFLCGSYLLAIYAGKQMFPEENEGVITLAVSGVFISPAFISGRVLSLPENIVIFCVWLCICLMEQINKRPTKSRMVIFSLVLVIIGSFEIYAVGIIAGFLVCLLLCDKKHQLKGEAFLSSLLIVILGLAVCNIAERVLFALWYEKTDLNVLSSAEVFLDGISSGWSDGQINGLLAGLSAKSFSLMASSVLLICPAVVFGIKTLRREYKGDFADSITINGIFFAFLAELFIMILYDNSGNTYRDLVSLRGLKEVLGPMLLLGIMGLKYEVTYRHRILECLGIFSVSAKITASLFESGGISSLDNVECGILSLFQGLNMNATGSIYAAACYVIVFILFVKTVLYAKKVIKERKSLADIVILLTVAGIIIFTDFFIAYTGAVLPKKELRDRTIGLQTLFAEMTIAEDIYYLEDSSINVEIDILQSVFPNNSIKLIRNREDVKTEFFESVKGKEESCVIITGNNPTLLEKTGDALGKEFCIVYLADTWAIWTGRNSEIKTELDRGVSYCLKHFGREEDELSNSNDTINNQTEDGSSDTSVDKAFEYVYTYDRLLAPGTYCLELHIEGVDYSGDFSGNLTVLDGNSVLANKAVNADFIDGQRNGLISIDFCSATMIRNAKITFEGTGLKDAEITDVFCWKKTSRYSFGLKDTEEAKKAGRVISQLDSDCGLTGDVGLFDDRIVYGEEVCADYISGYLSDHLLYGLSRTDLTGELPTYMITETARHAYRSLLYGYSIIYRGETYTVLVRNNSAQYMRAYDDNQLKSDGQTICLTGLKRSTKKKLSLESGEYIGKVQVDFDTEAMKSNDTSVLGTVYVYKGDTEFGAVEFSGEDLKAGRGIIDIPFTLEKSRNGIRCRVEMRTGTKADAVWTGVELAEELYQYGHESKELASWLKRISELQITNAVFAPVLAVSSLDKELTGFTYLQDSLANCVVTPVTYTGAVDMNGDAILLTKGYSASFLKLVDKYSIFAHADQYTLWARSNGTIMQQLVKSGIGILSGANGVSCDSILRASGKTDVDEIKLGKGMYSLTIELVAENIDPLDTVEVIVSRLKSDDELDAELSELLEQGYEAEDALRYISQRAVIGTETIQANRFGSNKSLIAVVKTQNALINIEDINVEAYSWDAAEITSKLLWIKSST